MAENQILFRVSKETLDELDEAISVRGFKTRNEWLRAQIRLFLEETRQSRLQELLDKTTTKGVREEDIVAMVKEWREKKRNRGRP
jgi:metal-responsive CopG/Arc/MetJ family transcriptional regulator